MPSHPRLRMEPGFEEMFLDSAPRASEDRGGLLNAETAPAPRSALESGRSALLLWAALLASCSPQGAEGLLVVGDALEQSADTAGELLDTGNEEWGVAVAGEAVLRGWELIGGLGSPVASPQRFADARFFHATVAYSGWLYVIGGCRSEQSSGVCVPADILDSVLVARISSDGSIGAYSPVRSLPSPRYEHDAVVYSGRLYVVGGRTAGGYLDEVQVARLDPSTGAIGVWASTAPLAVPTANAAVVANDNALYALGGEGPLSASVHRALVRPDGTLEGWTLTSTLTQAKSSLGAGVHNGWIYAVGGWTGASAATVERAAIHADRTLGPFRTARALPDSRHAPSLAVHNGHLYVLGGANGATSTLPALLAPIFADGSVGGWTSGPTLIGHRVGGAVFAGHAYVTGGFGGGGVAFDSTQILPFEGTSPATGEVSAWRAEASFAIPRMHADAVVHGDRLYVIGGCSAGLADGSCTATTADIQTAAIDPGGSLGPFTAASTPLPAARSGPASLVVGGRLYVVGGRTAAAGGNSGETLISSIDASGALGPFAASPSLHLPRWGASVVFYEGHLYVISGQLEDGTNTTSIERAPVLADGSVGAWTSAGSTAPPGRSKALAVVHDRHLYLVGGWAGMNLTTVESAPFLADGTVGAFSTLPGLNTGRSNHAGGFASGLLYVTGGSTGGGHTRQSEVAVLLANGMLGSWSAGTELLAVQRARHTSVIHRGTLYVLGGHDGTSLLGTVEASSLSAPTAMGSYSRLFDLGAASTLECITVLGSAERPGTVRVSYRVAGGEVSAAFGPTVLAGTVRPPAVVPISESNARYAWVQLTLDDTTTPVRDPAAALRDVTEVRLTYGGGSCPDLQTSSGAAGIVPPDQLRLSVGCDCSHPSGGALSALAVLALGLWPRREDAVHGLRARRWSRCR